MVRNLHDPADERAHLERQEPALMEDVARGREAERIMSEPLLVDALAEIRNEAFSAFVSADPFKPDQLQAARRMYDAVDTFQQKLASHIATGKLADDELGFVRTKINEIKERWAA